MAEIDADYETAVKVLASASGPGVQGAELDVDSMFSETMLRGEMDYERAIKILSGWAVVQKPQAYADLKKTHGAGGFSKGLAGAEHELDSVIKGAEDAVGNMIEGIEQAAAGRAGRPVLVNLSLQDQISELEKISLGFDENVFDRDKLRIVETEVRSLARVVRSRKQQSGPRELIDIRARRLAEVEDKLKHAIAHQKH
ncbi:MAG: hypothetical protein M1321_03110 [Candidatus Marsarchaeota archaeon]|nr:hypothetical protein [Candidatus Marsarchaeota archaeon]